MQRLSISFALIALLVAIPQLASALSAGQIVERLDGALVPSNVEADYTFINVRTDGQRVTYTMRVRVRDENHVHMAFRAPGREAGREVLNVGSEIWSYLPSTGRVVRLQERESFAGGDFSNADVFRGDWSTTYTPAIISESDRQWVLDLRARSNNAPYARMRVWVDRSTVLPVQQHFFDSSGTLLKRIVYGSVRSFGTVTLPTRAVVENAVTGERSEWRINSMSTNQTFADSVFAVGSLGR